MNGWDESDAFDAAVPLSQRALAARPAPYLDDLNPAQRAAVEALTAVIRLLNGFGGVAPQEATIGLVAVELNIDPSRASRITADLIARGYLLREVSQTDGRKSVLALTEKAHELLKSFLDLKWTKSMQVFADWDEADIVTFSTLFVRYTAAMQAAYPGR